MSGRHYLVINSTNYNIGIADATPPHLDVMLRLGGSLRVHGSLQFFAFGLFSLFSTVFDFFLKRLECSV